MIFSAERSQNDHKHDFSTYLAPAELLRLTSTTSAPASSTIASNCFTFSMSRENFFTGLSSVFFG